MIARIKISNHPIFSDVERFVNISGFNLLDLKDKVAIFKYYIEYKQGGVDVSAAMNQNFPTWRVDGDHFDAMITALAVESDKAAGVELVMAGEVSRAESDGLWS